MKIYFPKMKFVYATICTGTDTFRSPVRHAKKLCLWAVNTEQDFQPFVQLRGQQKWNFAPSWISRNTKFRLLKKIAKFLPNESFAKPSLCQILLAKYLLKFGFQTSTIPKPWDPLASFDSCVIHSLRYHVTIMLSTYQLPVSTITTARRKRTRDRSWGTGTW